MHSGNDHTQTAWDRRRASAAHRQDSNKLWLGAGHSDGNKVTLGPRKLWTRERRALGLDAPSVWGTFRACLTDQEIRITSQ